MGEWKEPPFPDVPSPCWKSWSLAPCPRPSPSRPPPRQRGTCWSSGCTCPSWPRVFRVKAIKGSWIMSIGNSLEFRLYMYMSGIPYLVNRLVFTALLMLCVFEIGDVRVCILCQDSGPETHSLFFRRTSPRLWCIASVMKINSISV